MLEGFETVKDYERLRDGPLPEKNDEGERMFLTLTKTLSKVESDMWKANALSSELFMKKDVLSYTIDKWRRHLFG